MTDQDARLIRRLITKWGFHAVLLELIRLTTAYCRDSTRWYGVKAALKHAHMIYVVKVGKI